MHEILRWLTFKLAQNPKMNFFSKAEPSKKIRSEKVSHLGILPRDRDFEPI